MTPSRHLVRSIRLAFSTAVLALASPFSLAAAADKITFVTDYGLYGRHAYYFVAMDKGYYARENLEVEIVRSPGSANTIKQVANRTAQLGFADLSAVRQLRTWKREGNFVADFVICCAADDLASRAAAVVHLANGEPIGIRMTRGRGDLRNDHVVDVRAARLDIFRFDAGAS